jgi:hypothetical protein
VEQAEGKPSEEGVRSEEQPIRIESQAEASTDYLWILQAPADGTIGIRRKAGIGVQEEQHLTMRERASPIHLVSAASASRHTPRPERGGFGPRPIGAIAIDYDHLEIPGQLPHRGESLPQVSTLVQRRNDDGDLQGLV